jgi:PAS domain S-box-containing protein
MKNEKGKKKGAGKPTKDAPVPKTPVRKGSDKPSGEVVAMHDDVMERKKAEEALRASDQLLARAQEIAHFGSWELDVAGNTLTWSDEVYRIFGLQPQEFGATYGAFLEAVHPDDRLAVDAAYSGSVREGKDSYEIEHRIVRKKTGEVRIVHEKCEHVRDASGRIVRSVGMVHDITERKRAEEGLCSIAEAARLQTAELEALMKAVPAAILISRDPQCRVITGNLAAYELLRMPPGTNTSKSSPETKTGHFRIFHAGQETQPQDLPVQRAAASGKPIHGYEEQLVFENGDSVWVYGNSVPLLDADGKPAGAVAAFIDITERKKAEEEKAARNRELEELNRELEAFNYSISHDLRAPLRVMGGFVKALDEDYAGKLDEQGRDYLARISKGSHKMSRLIDGLLKLSKVSRQKVRRADVDMSATAAVAAAALREEEPERNVAVSIQERLAAWADPALMEIILGNLLENAWKFTSKKVNAEITVGAMEKDGRTVFYVRDNGAGFDPGFKEKIFLPFQRLHSEKEFEGTGIGLATVERIIRNHGGKVWTESEVDKGVTIYFTVR